MEYEGLMICTLSHWVPPPLPLSESSWTTDFTNCTSTVGWELLLTPLDTVLPSFPRCRIHRRYHSVNSLSTFSSNKHNHNNNNHNNNITCTTPPRTRRTITPLASFSSSSSPDTGRGAATHAQSYRISAFDIMGVAELDDHHDDRRTVQVTTSTSIWELTCSSRNSHDLLLASLTAQQIMKRVEKNLHYPNTTNHNKQQQEQERHRFLRPQHSSSSSNDDDDNNNNNCSSETSQSTTEEDSLYTTVSSSSSSRGGGGSGGGPPLVVATEEDMDSFINRCIRKSIEQESFVEKLERRWGKAVSDIQEIVTGGGTSSRLEGQGVIKKATAATV